MSTDELPEWLHEGAEVAIIRNGWAGWEIVRETTIDRIMTRDIVLTTGERFNRRYLRLDNEAVLKRSAHTFGASTYLVRRNDHRVSEAHAIMRRNVAEIAVGDAYEKWRRDTSSNEALNDLIKAVDALHKLEQGDTGNNKP